MKLKLSAPLARNSAANEYDVKQVKKALNRLGYYTPYEKTGITGIPDDAVFTALKAFQKDQGLSATGTAKPDDETVRALNEAQENQPEGCYIWCTVGDDKVRDSHADREGQEFCWDNPPVGGHPGEEINCRCWAELVVDKVEREELPPPKIETPKIPGTDIPDRGIPEQGWPGSPKYDPYYDDGRDRAAPLLPIKPPNPNIDPTMELPYAPWGIGITGPYKDI